MVLSITMVCQGPYSGVQLILLFTVVIAMNVFSGCEPLPFPAYAPYNVVVASSSRICDIGDVAQMSTAFCLQVL